MKGRDIILGILSTKERSGYEINDILKNRLSYFYDGTYGMIYPTLRKLEKEGKISKKIIIQEGKPNKNSYSITDLGKKEFEVYLQSEVDSDIFKSDFLMRLFFGSSLDKSTLRKLIVDEIARSEQKIKNLENNLEIWQEEGMSYTQKVTVKYGLAQYRANKEVLEEELQHLNEL